MQIPFDYDFIGFEYNGVHSIRDLGIYRTSNNDFYDDKINGTVKDTYVSIPQVEGKVLTNTKITQKEFNLSFAYDGLTEERLNKLQKLLRPLNPSRLIFDEEPYKVYTAIVSAPPTLEYIPFDDGKGGTIYKGEGSIRFVCYDPLARNQNFNEDYKEVEAPTGTNTCYCGLWLPIGRYSFYVGANDSTGYEGTATAFQMYSGDTVLKSDMASKTIFVTKEMFIEKITFGAIRSPQLLRLKNSEGVFAFFEGMGLVGFSGKTCNGYSMGRYPTKKEWMEASGLPRHQEELKNCGQEPTSFIVEGSNNVDSAQQYEISVNQYSILVPVCEYFEWNSKTGNVSYTDSTGTR